MSERRGTPRRVVRPWAIRQAARMGSEEFLLPLISTLPLSRFPPRTRKLSIAPVLGPRNEVLGWPEKSRHLSEEVSRELPVYRPVLRPTINPCCRWDLCVGLSARPTTHSPHRRLGG